MPKVHFFKLAQELGERPVELQKKLASAGIAVRSTSTMIDEETATKIRDIRKQELAKAVETVTAQPAPPTTEEAPAEAPAPTSATVPTEPRPVTRVIKRVTNGDGQQAVQRAEVRQAPQQKQQQHKPAQQPGTQQTRAERPNQANRPGQPGGGNQQQRPPRKVRSLLLTPETDGGLSPDAEFGIVKAAGVVPMPQARPERPPRRPGGDHHFQPRQPRPEGGGGGYRPRGPIGGGHPGGGHPGGPATMPPVAPPAGEKGGKGIGRSTTAKKKQKRTVFADKEKSSLQKKRNEISSTTIRSRRKRKGPNNTENGQFVIEEPIVVTGPMTVGEIAERVHISPAQS